MVVSDDLLSGLAIGELAARAARHAEINAESFILNVDVCGRCVCPLYLNDLELLDSVGTYGHLYTCLTCYEYIFPAPLCFTKLWNPDSEVLRSSCGSKQPRCASAHVCAYLGATGYRYSISYPNFQPHSQGNPCTAFHP
jgi:hypothetical protein